MLRMQKKFWGSRMKKVGDILREARLKGGFSIKDSSKFTRIHEQYLKALESGNYTLFSDRVHIRGFIQNYAKFLGLNFEEILAVWRREYKDEDNKIYTTSSSNGFSGVFITPKFVMAGLIIVLSLGFSLYLYFQYQSYAGVPPLLIESPEDNLVTTTREIWIKGRSYKNTFVYVNGEEVKTTETGSFRFPVSLDLGLNNIIIKASNRLGKETEIKLNVVYNQVKE